MIGMQKNMKAPLERQIVGKNGCLNITYSRFSNTNTLNNIMPLQFTNSFGKVD